jgi:hypothetical protein
MKFSIPKHNEPIVSVHRKQKTEILYISNGKFKKRIVQNKNIFFRRSVTGKAEKRKSLFLSLVRVCWKVIPSNIKYLPYYALLPTQAQSQITENVKT